MIDDRFAAMRQEMWERLDEVINQMDVQRRDFEEQLAALTQATEGQVADSAAMRAEMDALRQDVAGQTPPAEPAPQPAPVLDGALAELRARLEEVERSHHGGHHHHHHHHRRSTSNVSDSNISGTTPYQMETLDKSVEQLKQSPRLSGPQMDMDDNDRRIPEVASETFEAEGGDWDENHEQSQWTGTGLDENGQLKERTSMRREYVSAVMLDCGDMYELNESVWDVMMFAGHPAIGSLNTSVLWGIYFLNLALQCMFIFLVQHLLMEEVISPQNLDGLLKFR
ncbi:unnamed protein product, partial [Prorocentrum cordatum]